MIKSREPEQSYLNSILRYEDGKLYWREYRRGININKEAGALRKDGYRQICIDKSMYEYHRIVYTMRKGAIPDGKFVDHKDGDRSNNAEDNLRLATNSQNNRNCKHRKVSASGHRHIRVKPSGRFELRLRLGVNEEPKSFGVYDTLEEAIQVRDKLNKAINGNFALNN